MPEVSSCASRSRLEQLAECGIRGHYCSPNHEALSLRLSGQAQPNLFRTSLIHLLPLEFMQLCAAGLHSIPSNGLPSTIPRRSRVLICTTPTPYRQQQQQQQHKQMTTLWSSSPQPASTSRLPVRSDSRLLFLLYRFYNTHTRHYTPVTPPLDPNHEPRIRYL